MKNILLRAGCTPFTNPDPIDAIKSDAISQNAGNLIFAYSVTRALMTDSDVSFTCTRNNVSDSSPQELSEKYDMFVIPMADAFRQDYAENLKNYTKLIRSLKIPCVLIGAGLKAPIGFDVNTPLPFDNEVRDFISAVLDKSAIVGVRGEATGDYLTRLGFKAERDFTVIGCPSMYTFGRELNIKDVNITKDSVVSVNSSVRSPQKLLDFIDKSAQSFKNRYFVPQLLNELKTVYAGIPYTALKNIRYHRDLSDPYYAENRARFFLNVPSWLDFLKSVDFSFGARLHGNIAAVISGTPSLMLVKDKRMNELAEYHGLTCVNADEIDEDTDIFKLIEKADFKSPLKKQAKNFDHYIDFLNKNKIDHIYKDDINRKTCPFDEAIAKIKFQPAVVPLNALPLDKQSRRLGAYNSYMNELLKESNDRYENLTGKFKKLGFIYKAARKLYYSGK